MRRDRHTGSDALRQIGDDALARAVGIEKGYLGHAEIGSDEPANKQRDAHPCSADDADLQERLRAGNASIPPAFRVDAAPMRLPALSAADRDAVRSHAARKPPLNASPAPVVSTAATL